MLQHLSYVVFGLKDTSSAVDSALLNTVTASVDQCTRLLANISSHQNRFDVRTATVACDFVAAGSVRSLCLGLCT